MKAPEQPLTEDDLARMAFEDFKRDAEADGIVFIEGDDFFVDPDFDDVDAYAD